MRGSKWLEILPNKKLGELSDLADWRNYYFDIILAIAVISLPIGLAVTFSSYLSERHYEIIAFEIGIVVFLFFIRLIRKPFLRVALYFMFFGVMIFAIFLLLGPFYARPGWLVLTAVVAALLLGATAAIAVIALNASLLTIIYLFIGPHLHTWAPVFAVPASTWIIFVVNISLLSLAASLPVSMLLTRLTISFSQELDLRRNLSQEKEFLNSTNISLQKEISDRKQIEDDLSESKNFLDKIINSVADPILVKDRQHRWVLLNDACCIFIGHNRHELLGKSDYDFFPKDEADVFWEKDEAVFSSGLENTNEEKFTDARGVVHTIVTKKTLYTDVKGEQFIVGIIRDITERKQAEEEKKKIEMERIPAQKMEALGRFAGGIAHDLNNILYPVIIDTELLLEESVPDTGLHQTLNKILNASYRQRDLIRQILSFSRRSELKLTPIKVAPVLRETINLLRSSLPSTIRIKIHFDVHSDTILGDSTQIQQILMNLFRNAADAIVSRKGTIEVRLENTRIESSAVYPDLRAGRFIKLMVKDTGHGMTREVKDRIFEPFYTTKGIGKGSGLGLSVVHGILQNHGGVITVESEPGKGTEFTVLLPIIDEEIHIQRPLNAVFPSKGTGRVLLVDDEEIILSSVQNALKRLGYDVVAVKNGLEALDLFKATPHTFDLVITDLTMPQITGVELAKKLMDIQTDIPIILCTGFNDVIKEDEAKAMGIRELLIKPSGIRELKTAISWALEN